MVNDIQKLREITGAGVMECKHALEESRGDFDKARVIIRKKGVAKAEKKGGRATGAGILESYIHNDRVGVLLELRCETDFVARNEIFRELGHNIAMHIAAMNPENIDELMGQNYIKDESKTIEELIKEVIARLGENIKIERFCRYEI